MINESVSFEDYIAQKFSWEFRTMLTGYQNDTYFWEIYYKQQPPIEISFVRGFHDEEVTCLWLTESIFKTLFDFFLGLCEEFICADADKTLVKLTIYQLIHRLNLYNTEAQKILVAFGEYDLVTPETAVSLQDAFSISYATESRLRSTAKGLLKSNGIYCSPQNNFVFVKPLSRY